MLNYKIQHDHPYKRRRRRLRTVVAAASTSIMLLHLATVVQPFLLPSVGGPCRVSFERKVAVIPRITRWRLWNENGASDVSKLNENQVANDSTNSSSYWISPEQLDRLKESVDIVSVVESYNLKGFQRKGENRATAVCPFHDDHNPSMSVDGNRRLYKCFSCGAGGDVFNFVREYSALESEKPTFYQAVRQVAQKFGDASIQQELSVPTSSKSRMSQEQRKELEAKKKRILLANAAAADFFGKCLITLPAAGGARAHLRQRGIAPATVRAFAMGYAPDVYFQEKGGQWGEGSLVHHLRDAGFKASEILEAGLATRTKKAQWKDIVTEDSQNSADSKDTLDEDYSTLIDRFRGRLMVPIFDSDGKNVIAFGGRILATEEDANSDFKAPKYLNSPESLVFQKKSELFGHDHARKAVKEQKSQVSATGQERGSVVIVEGYMDAIALWDVGVREVVASMGTALTMEQLAVAAKIAGARGGKIILCLDGDDAGINAVERVCSGSLLAKISETYVVEILVATLPPGVKDPADFIETRTKGSKTGIGDLFRNEVLNNSTDWVAWYLDRLLARYDPRALRGMSGSFGDVCDRVSEFISTFPNPADRTKRAHDIVGSLAEAIANDSGETTVSSALRIQLESDLVAMVARKAGAKESVERRIESVDGMSPERTSSTLAKMAKGDTTATSDEDTKLSTKALRLAKRATPRGLDSRRDGFSDIDEQGQQTKRYKRSGDRKRLKRQPRKQAPPPLTPHFSGFEFENQSDTDWLGVTRDKWKRRGQHLALGLDKRTKALRDRDGGDYIPGLNFGEAVYFNSNQYHGNEFITQDAMEAGYSNEAIARDSFHIEHGVASLIALKEDDLIMSAEDKLLRCLVTYAPARSAMKTALATSEATGSDGAIEWSSFEREWLFRYLVERIDEIPYDVLANGKLEDLRLYLATVSDSPPGAFGYVRAGQEPEGCPPTEISTTNNILPSTMENRGVNVPSDTEEIENWASSYEPLVFDPENPDEATGSGMMNEASSPATNLPLENSEFESRETQCPDGSLDMFFAHYEDIFATTYDESVSRELRAELEVQEALATLLTASALKRLARIKQDYIVATNILELRQSQEEEPAAMVLSNNDSPETDKLRLMTTDDLNTHCLVLVKKIRDLSETAQHLHSSSKRIGSRLMDYSSADGLEGRISLALQEELAAAVDEHVAHLPEIWHNESLSNTPHYGNGRSHYNIDPRFGWRDDDADQEDVLAREMSRIESEWGHWSEDEYNWSPAELTETSTSWARNDDLQSNEMSEGELFGAIDDYYGDEEEESLEDAIERIDREWGGFDDENVAAASLANGSSQIMYNTVKDDFEDSSVDESTDDLGDDVESVFQ